MDALEFMHERKRMCESFGINCLGCPAKENDYCIRWQEEIVLIVEKWSAEHPRKTHQSEFLKQWPETNLDAFGVIQICPIAISAVHRDESGECKDPERLCIDCRREFWMQEIE